MEDRFFNVRGYETPVAPRHLDRLLYMEKLKLPSLLVKHAKCLVRLVAGAAKGPYVLYVKTSQKSYNL